MHDRIERHAMIRKAPMLNFRLYTPDLCGSLLNAVSTVSTLRQAAQENFQLRKISTASFSRMDGMGWDGTGCTYRCPQLWHSQKVVIGSSADLVWAWGCYIVEHYIHNTTQEREQEQEQEPELSKAK
jgi:hypothetical protein